MLPILNLNGYKIANPTILARIPEDELMSLMRGYGYAPVLVSGGFDDEDHMAVHARFADALEQALDDIAAIQKSAREDGNEHAPDLADDHPEDPQGLDRTEVRRRPAGREHLASAPGADRERSRQAGAPAPAAGVDGELPGRRTVRRRRHDRSQSSTRTDRRASAACRPTRTATAACSNARSTFRSLDDHAVDVSKDRGVVLEPTRVLGGWLRDIISANPDNFRIFGPDETASNRLDDVYAVTAKAWQGEYLPVDENLAHEGRVIEALSENLMQGLLEGYTLTGRHGLFNSYEAFIHVVDAMFNQHAKWLESAAEVPWRRPIPSFNYLLSSHVWRQDHNGFSHQDPGFLDHVVNKRASVVRVYLPADANQLLVTAEHIFRTHDYVNVIVAGKQPTPTFLSLEEAREHGTARPRRLGLGRHRGRGRSTRMSWSRAQATFRRSRRWRPCRS